MAIFEISTENQGGFEAALSHYVQVHDSRPCRMWALPECGIWDGADRRFLWGSSQGLSSGKTWDMEQIAEHDAVMGRTA